MKDRTNRRTRGIDVVDADRLRYAPPAGCDLRHRHAMSRRDVDTIGRARDRILDSRNYSSDIISRFNVCRRKTETGALDDVSI